MATLTDLAIQRQREAEHLFAAACNVFPADALAKCAWLKPDLLIDEKVKSFWTHFTNGSHGDPTDAGIKARCLGDLNAWGNILPPGSFYPEKFAAEIVRANYWIKFDPMLADLVKARQDMDDKTVKSILDRMVQRVPGEPVAIPDALDASLKFIEWLESDIKAIETHIPKLDKALAGLDYQALTILAARPSMGKTTLAVQIARNVAKTKKVLVFSNEMSVLAWWRKAICGIAEVDYRKIKSGELSREEKDRLKDIAMETAEQCADRLKIDDRTHHTSETIWQLTASEKPDLVVVDILANVQDKNDREVLRLGNIIRNLRNMAKSLDCHVMVLHHVNRASTQKENKMPCMEDLRESGELEQTADNVMFMHSEVVYQGKELPANIPVVLRVDKNREGPRRIDINLIYDTKHQWFEGA